MDNYRLLHKSHDSLLNFYYCGTQACKPGHFYGPALRDHYLIHYIHSGKGIFKVDGKTYHLKEKDGFLICPGVIVYYKADDVEPWHYSWIAFKGDMVGQYLKLADLSQNNPVFRYDRDYVLEDCFKQLIAAQSDNSLSREFRLLGLTYILMSCLISVSGNNLIACNKNNKDMFYIDKAVEYIYSNYSKKITISEISKHVMLDRKYLCSIFKKNLNISPRELLIKFRIRKACELLKSKNLSIADIARSVGYDDPMQFSRMFKKVLGRPPSKFRQKSTYI